MKIKNLKLKIKESLAVLLIVLILASTLKFVFFRPKVALADTLLLFNEGYGTSINDNNGNVSAGTIASAVWKAEEFCKEDKCLYFDGTGDKITFSDDADLDFVASDNFTLQGWFRTPDITSGQRTLIAKHNATAGGYKVYMDSNGYLIFGVDDDSTWSPDDSASTTTTAFDDNKWHFFSAVKTGTTSITIYVDGIQYQTDSSIAATGTLANADSLLIGIDGDGSSNGFSGFLDGIKIYRSARTAAEIKTDYTGETPSRGVSASFGPDQSYLTNGLTGYWKLDESSGNATDYSGNGLTLTNNATTTFVAGKFGNGSEHVPASSQYLSTATTISGVKTVSFWTNPDSTTNYFVSLTSGAYITASSGTLSATGFTNPTIYVNGVASTTIAANVWQFVSVITDTAIDANQFYLGRQGSNYYDGTLDEARLYNRVLTPAEIQKLYSWSPGPVGHWKLDENTGTSTVYDSSTNGRNGTMNSLAADDWVRGKYGSGLDFDAANDDISIADDDVFSANTTNQLTVMAWFKPSVLNVTQSVVSKGSGGIYEWDLRINGDGTFFPRLYNPAGTNYLVVTQNYQLTIDTWYHLAFVADLSIPSLKAYVNGVLVNEATTTSGSYTNGTATVRIGERADNNNDIDGIVDDVRIYNFARTTSQIIEDMNAGHPAPGSPIGSAVAHWKFDEGYSTTAYDSNTSTGGAEDLTLSTASWTNSGKFGKAFNGLTNVRASRADDDDLDFGAGEDFTFSMWFKSDSATNPSDNEYLLEKGGNVTTDAIGYAVYTSSASDGLICIGIDDDATTFPEDSVCSSSDYYDGTWHHLTAVKTANSKLELYIDGKPNGTPDTSISATGTLANASTFYIGDTNATDGTDEFLGDIDEVKIYRSALSSDQVIVEYNRGFQSQMGALSTDSTNAASNADLDSYCPPGQGSTCVPPVGHWRIDENTGSSVNDISGNGATGTITGALWTPGKLGSALKFDGDNDDVTTVDADRFSITTTNQLTVMAWVKISLSTAIQNFVTKVGTGGALEWTLKVNADETPRVVVYNTGGTAYLGDSASTALVADTWYHVAFTVDTANPSAKVYVNGAYIAEDTTTFGTLEANDVAPVVFGATDDGSDDLNGIIDDVRIYDYVRTPAQIAWDMNQGDPLLHWKFDENTGSPTTLYDSSLNALNGTANGSMDSSDWLTGKFNSSLDFDGSDDVISRANSWPIDLNQGLSQGFTFATWIYPNTVGETAGRIFQKSTNGSTTDSSSTFCRVAGSTPFDVECNLDLATSDAVLTVSAAAPANTWTHVAFSWTNDADDEVTIWVNGVPSTSNASYDGVPTADTFSLFVAGNGTTTSNTRAFDGQIDDFRIYSYELTAQQIKMLMNEASAVKF